MRFVYKYLIIFIVIFLAAGCDVFLPRADVSDIEINPDIRRFEMDLFSEEYQDIDEKISVLRNKYPDFFDLYTNQIIQIGSSNQKDFNLRLKSFLIDFGVEKSISEVNRKFSEFELIEQEIKSALKHFKFYFPDKEIPNIITFVSGFRMSVAISDSLIAIGLDRYLGAENPIYDNLGVPKYLQKKMKASNIARDCLLAWMKSEFEYFSEPNYLINRMIYEGVILYSLEMMLADYEDFEIIGYTEQEWKWCEKNSKKMWEYLVGNKKFYITEPMEINRFVGDAPFTYAFGKNSPGATGNWFGWQIVRAYMKKNPGIKINDLVREKDFQKILSNSNFKP